ncbi:hypothetical protein HC891_08330 [Candidatus Gracilibacteria bacterium]|nr:hypothetical protein [Candidatus Gracilibacteria bacterium]
MAYVLAFDPPLSGRATTRLLATVEADVVVGVEYRAATAELLPTDRIRRVAVEQGLTLLSEHVPATAWAYSLVYCQALEALLDLTVPPRAAYLRTACCELERMASHLAQVAALLDLLGLGTFHERLTALDERLRQLRADLQGEERPVALCLPGGLPHDIDTAKHDGLLAALAGVLRRLVVLANAVIEQRALPARTVDVGTISRSAAEQFLLRGPLARAAVWGSICDWTSHTRPTTVCRSRWGRRRAAMSMRGWCCCCLKRWRAPK